MIATYLFFTNLFYLFFTNRDDSYLSIFLHLYLNTSRDDSLFFLFSPFFLYLNTSRNDSSGNSFEHKEGHAASEHEKHHIVNRSSHQNVTLFRFKDV